jgi:signal transduction histidine kinase
LQIGPTTLKFISDSLITLLIDQQIPAVLWAKLPRSGTWWTGLERYVTLSNVARGLYLFSHHRDEPDESGNPSTVASGDNPIAEPQASPLLAASTPTPVVSLQFPSDSPLRREYFLIIWSDRFQAGVFAHRPRSVQVLKIAESIPADLDLLSSYGQPSQLLDPPSDRKQLLHAVYSFTPNLLTQALQHLEQRILTDVPPLSGRLTGPEGTAMDLAANQLVAHWQEAVAGIAPITDASPPLAPFPWIEQIFSKHLQQQEELSQRNTFYRKQAEQAESLRLQNEELANTLRLKDDFLSNVGQELRTPLTTIKTALSLLNSPNIKPPQRQRYMDLITKECDRQSSLITSLLDLVQLDQSNDQAALPPLRLSDVVPGVVSTYQPVSEEKGVRLAYTVPEDLPPVACMSNWLKQIVINLLHNGIKYTPRGGQVWVRATQQGDYVQLEVRDTGVGIAPSEIPKIFDRFYRVRQAADDSSGAGLGLTIVQQLLLHCGGSISVKSKLGEGSTFNILLPIYRGPSESPP